MRDIQITRYGYEFAYARTGFVGSMVYESIDVCRAALFKLMQEMEQNKVIIGEWRVLSSPTYGQWEVVESGVRGSNVGIGDKVGASMH